MAGPLAPRARLILPALQAMCRQFPVTCRDVFLLPGRLSGIATGAIYGLIAVGYSLTFMTTKALNFALGMWVMLGGMLTYSLIVLHGIHPLLVLPAVIVALFLLGLVAERFTVLPFLQAGSDVWVMSTLAVGLLMIDFAEIIWGRSPTPVPPFLGKDPIYLGAVSILPQQLLIIAAACITFVGLDLFYRRPCAARRSAPSPTAVKWAA